MSKPSFVISASHAKKISDEQKIIIQRERAENERQQAYQTLKPVFEGISKKMNGGEYCLPMLWETMMMDLSMN